MGQKTAVKQGIGALLFCLLMAVGMTAIPSKAWAAPGGLHCDPTIRTEMERINADAWTRAQDRLTRNFPRPNSFNSLFCSAQITNMFNSLNQSLVSAIFGQIKNLIDSLMRQACQAAVAPLQMAANAICIPAFNFNLNFSLPGMSTGVCNGTPLFNVTPVVNPYTYQGGGGGPTSILP